MHICTGVFRLELTHVVGTKQKVGGEDEEHEVNDGVQQQRLLEGTLQVMACTGTVNVSHHSNRCSSAKDGPGSSCNGTVQVAQSAGRRS